METVRWFDFPGESAPMPRCGLTLAAAGPMKPGRDAENRKPLFGGKDISPSQIHSRIVHSVDSAASFNPRPEGDGVLTRNRELVPCVTVADCMPVYLFDPETGCFGALHSGWRGTGIIRSALELASREWGAKSADFRVVLGPHIRSCCYTVDLERARLFAETYGRDCVAEDAERMASGSPWPWRLSLARANVSLCLSLGIPAGHILDSGLCTSCTPEFGSSRREGAETFTHMAAFTTWQY